MPGRVRGRDGHASALHERGRAHVRRHRGGGLHAAGARASRSARCSAACPSTGSRSARPSDFTKTTYATKVITIVQGIGEAGNSIAYVAPRNPAIDTEPEDQYNQFVALSSRCMHLGCPVRFVSAAERFICPCHGGVYDFRGLRRRRAARPPAGPLLHPAQQAGMVEIGPRYSVNSELQRFSPRDPGEPLDGIGQYLYPKRFDTSILPKS